MKVPPKSRKWVGFNATGDLGPFTIYTSRRAGTVWFIKAPPLEPPSYFQTRCRNRFRQAAKAWQFQTQEQRDAWNTACRRLNLIVNGYTLWIFWQLRRNRPAIRTIERQSGIKLLPS